EAAAYLRKNQFDESRNILEKLLKFNPNQADTLLELAVLDLMQKKYQEAEELFRKAYNVDPSNLRGLLGVVEIHFQRKEPEKAVKVLTDEVQKNPQRIDLKKELANAEFRAKQFDKSISDYQSIMDRYKDAPIEQSDILARTGVVYSFKGDIGKSIEYMQ